MALVGFGRVLFALETIDASADHLLLLPLFYQVKPFQVHPGPFLRDVGFSLAAVALLLFVIRDGRLEAWETLTLIGLYINYVLWIVVGTRILEWRNRRRKAVEEDGIGKSMRRSFGFKRS